MRFLPPLLIPQPPLLSSLLLLVILSQVLVSAAESPSAACSREITLIFPDIKFLPLDGLGSFFDQQVQELCKLLHLECEAPVVEDGITVPYTFNVSGGASVSFVMDGVRHSPSLCLWDGNPSLVDSAAASNVDAECDRKTASACRVAGIDDDSDDCQSMCGALRSAARTRWEELRKFLETAKRLVKATPIIIPAVTELADVLPSVGSSPDGRQWALLAVSPSGRDPESVRRSTTAVCLRDAGRTHNASAACAKFSEIAVYHARVAAGGSVRLTSALVMIFGALMVGLTTVTINGADITAVPPLGSKPGSSRPRIAFVDRLKGIAITSTFWVHTFGDGFVMPGTGSIPFEGTHLLPLTVLSNGHRGVNVFFVITGFVSASSGLTDSMRRAAHSSPREFLVEAASSVRRRLSKLLPPLLSFALLSLFFSPTPVDVLDPKTMGELGITASGCFWLIQEMFAGGIRNSGHLWSIGAIVGFHLVFPALIYAEAAVERRLVNVKMTTRNSQLQSSLIVAFLVLCFCFAVRVFATVFHPVFDGIPASPILLIRHITFLADTIPGRLDDFVVGALASRFQVAGISPRVPAIGVAWMILGCWLWDYTQLGLIPVWSILGCNTCFQIGCSLLLIYFSASDSSPHKPVYSPFRPLLSLFGFLGRHTFWMLLVHGEVIENVLKPFRFKDTVEVYALRHAVAFGMVAAMAVSLDGGFSGEEEKEKEKEKEP